MIGLKKIAVLDQNTIDKIAAGEVVERPSSVVKELVENAIDAGATAVTVEITDGGKKLIRITDNGSGIEAEEVPLAFMRHATSKIEKVDDLEHIVSLGFRGEALSSIAAVSQVELITKTPSAITGVRYVIEGGREHSMEELGAPEGTTFLVRNLFYNVPARSKFLKTDATEGNYISALMEQLALSHPEISFKYIQNKQVKLHTSGNYNVKDVIYNIYGREIAKSLLDVSYENDFMKITGFVGKPEISRGNRTFENYSVNGRYVKNKIITKAIEDGYKGFLMQHKFPFVSLQMEMNGNDLDVNVHPAKMEVRFARGAEVYEAIYETVRRALTRREMIPKVTVGREEKPEKKETVARGAVPEPFEVKRREQAMQSERASAYGNRVREESRYAFTPKNLEQTPFSKEEEALFKGSVNETSRDLKSSQQLNPPFGSQERSPLKNQQTGREEQLKEQADTLAKKSFTAETSRQQPDLNLWNEEQSRQAKELEPQIGQPEIQSENRDESVNEQSIEFQDSLNGQTENQREKADERPQKTEPPKQLELFEEKLLSPSSRNRHQLIGQIFDTYWLVQFEDNFYIIDQHAAHEKVYYERFVKQFKNREIHSQYISPPLIVSLNLQEEVLLKANMDYFRDFGFEIEPFGGKEYCISAVPAELYGMEEEELFLDMLDHLAGNGEKDALHLFTARLATMACKAAVKGNHKMSPAEADMLIDELLTLDNPYHCPHGRPTIISMSKAELEKKFKRIL